ncbi:serine/threonine-protein kinase [Klenkia terrae]|uniref:serine/threonine-protein kinase n=1 Tax=Klenkia terrae TaxID=1052259 RepID=UPI001CD843C9|nr:serine/threonine-protein kinase [Klenkia terrae]
MEPETRVLGNRYELRSVIATGGMGRVWRAHDRRLRRAVAVKVLRGEFAGDPEFIARFRAEARHTALLRDEHIAAVYDYGETEDDGEQLAYLVMELIEGEPLSALRRREGAVPADRTVDLLRQAATGLAVAHRAGVVHRDVKPGNLLVRPDGSLTITDFGIAWSAASVALTGTGEVIGTAHYLSPEQAQGLQATAASDVYALGMVGYELLAGRRAFTGDNPVAVVRAQISDEPEPLPATVPVGVRELVAAMLVKNPADRLADGAAVLAEVERLVERGLGPATVKLSTGGRHTVGPPPRRDRRRWVLAGAAALTALVASVAGVVVLGGSGEPPARVAAGSTSSAAATSVPPTPEQPAAAPAPGWSAPSPVTELGAATGTGLGQAVPTTPPPTTETPTTASTTSAPTTTTGRPGRPGRPTPPGPTESSSRGR